jgi:hypothetical protein
LRRSFSTIGGCLLLVASACAAHTDCKCLETAASPAASAAAPLAPASAPAPTNGGSSDALLLAGLANTLRDGIPRPHPKQFETPESALQFVFEKVASRDIAGSLVAFPVAEYYERVKLEDHIKYVGVFAPRTYPLDDDTYGRLSHALSIYLGSYRLIALKVLSDDSDGAITVTEHNTQAVLHEFDGARLKALRVVAIKDTHPESPPQLSPIDQAMGVTDKVLREVSVKLEDREVVVTALVGRVATNWRVLNMF